ncbi:MAG TPA: serine protease [Steroidobacteraceae bacterium]|jgi:hypothetical protein
MRIGVGLLRALISVQVVSFALLASTVVRAESLSAAAQQTVLAATFEVVQLKPPEEGPVTYEKPLPMELIPYQQRVDKYRSIGTAFAIGGNRYVTASHVFLIGAGSQYGSPALRNGAGEIFTVDRVLELSDEQDFVVFSLKKEPKDVRALPIGGTIPLNDPVFAVGNALGEGVVVRDGVYTSETPEEREGRWKWIRFTSPASPGNSGGPLVDKEGKVIGIVLRKSASENLNYAAPIKLIVDGSKSEGILAGRVVYRVPMMEASENIDTHASIPLPKSPTDFYAALMKEEGKIFDTGMGTVLKKNEDHLFPHGENSLAALHQIFAAPFPRSIREKQDKVWAAMVPSNIQKGQLDNNGRVEFGGGAVRMHAPDDVKLATLYGDSKLMMDLMLRSGGITIRRTIGSDPIKVTSLGKAAEEFVNMDSYGRPWQMKIYSVPFDDRHVIVALLPTPEGFSAVFLSASGMAKEPLTHELEMLTNYVWVTYDGSLARWREFLPLKPYQPKAFSKLSLEIDPDFKRVHFHSPRYDVTAMPGIVPMTQDSVLDLETSFFHDGDNVVWDVGGLSVKASDTKGNYMAVYRISRPEASLPENERAAWTKAAAGEFPYNGQPMRGDNGVRILTTVAADGSPSAGTEGPSVRYVLVVHNEGTPGPIVLHGELDSLKTAFKALEH